MKKFLIKKIRDKKFDKLLFQSGLHIQKTFRNFADNMEKKFDELMAKLELVGKRIEITEQKIALLKSKHGNLAQYCHEKIAYPKDTKRRLDQMIPKGEQSAFVTKSIDMGLKAKRGWQIIETAEPRLSKQNPVSFARKIRKDWDRP